MLVYEPPDRVVFSWGISPQWQIETEPDNTSEVEVTFIAETPQRTRVVLEHRHLDRHGPGWQAVGDSVAHDEGWPLYLSRYTALFTEGMSGRTRGPGGYDGGLPTAKHLRNCAASATDASISTFRIDTLSTLNPNGMPSRRQKVIRSWALATHWS